MHNLFWINTRRLGSNLSLGLLFTVVLLILKGCIGNDPGEIIDQSVDEAGNLIKIRREHILGHLKYQKTIYYPNKVIKCLYNVIPVEKNDLTEQYVNHGDFVCFYETGAMLSKGTYILGIQKEKVAFYLDGTLQGNSRVIDDSIAYTWIFYKEPHLLQEFTLKIGKDVIYTAGYDSSKNMTYSAGEPFFLVFQKDVVTPETGKGILEFSRILEFSIYPATDMNVSRAVFLDSLSIRDRLPLLDATVDSEKDSLVSRFTLNFPDTMSFFSLPLILKSTDWTKDSTYFDSILIDIKN